MTTDGSRRPTDLPTDLAAVIAQAGVDPTLPPRPLQDAPKDAIADRSGYITWDVDELGWRVDLLQPDREAFRGPTLEVALAWCLVWLMAAERGGGAFA